MSTRDRWIKGNPEYVAAREAFEAEQAGDVPWAADPAAYIKACKEKEKRVKAAKKARDDIEKQLGMRFDSVDN
jgi:hypothetical protein